MKKRKILILLVIFVSTILGKAQDDFHKTHFSADDLFPREVFYQSLNALQVVTAEDSWDSLPFTEEDVFGAVLPPALDWRVLGGVTAIDTQPQYGCGGCWVYAATAVFESLIKIATGREVDLSEEQISSCLPNGNHTGIAWQAFNYMQLNGVTTEQYVPCDFQFPVCNYPAYPDTFYPHDNWIIGLWDRPLAERIRIIKYIIQRFGPVAGGFKVFEDWARYREGVYLYDNVSPLLGHHSIEIVGWMDDPSLPNGGYWIIKNDLSEAWGENGFFRIGYGECQIDMSVVFAAWNPDTLYPVFALKVGTRYYSEGESISLPLFARVPEGHTPAYRAEGLPRGASYNETTGLFAWTPGSDQIGEHEIWFTAWYDGFETTQKGTFILLPARRP